MISEAAARAKRRLTPPKLDGSMTLEQARELWDSAARGAPLPDGVSEVIGDVAGVPCRTLSPVGVTDPQQQQIVWVHGGGLATGSSLTHRKFGASIVLGTGFQVVLVDYRRLPDNAFDDAFGDVERVLRSTRRHADVVVSGGDSCGAALAVSVAIACQRDDPSTVDAIVTICGAFDATLQSASIDQNRDPENTRGTLEHWRSTVAGLVEYDDPRLSPLLAADGDLAVLPPALFLAGEDDIWRDDSVRLAARLTEVGGRGEANVAEAMWHCWPMWTDLPESQAAVGAIHRFLGDVAA